MKSVNADGLVSRLRTLVRRPQREPRWLVVGDVELLVRAILGHPMGPSRKILEAAAIGVVVLVVSEQIRTETIEVICRNEFGSLSEDEATATVNTIVDSCRVIEPAADDPRYAKVVGDPDDRIVLRTAAGIFFHGDLSGMTKRAIVSGDKRSFPAGRNWYGFEYMSAAQFWQQIAEDNGGYERA